jgi:hypothetical protein
VFQATKAETQLGRNAMNTSAPRAVKTQDFKKNPFLEYQKGQSVFAL